MKLTKVIFVLFLRDHTNLYGITHTRHSSKRASGTRWMLCHRLSSRRCLPWSLDEACLNVTRRGLMPVIDLTCRCIGSLTRCCNQFFYRNHRFLAIHAHSSRLSLSMRARYILCAHGYGHFAH